jgi:hypothetical protein
MWPAATEGVKESAGMTIDWGFAAWQIRILSHLLTPWAKEWRPSANGLRRAGEEIHAMFGCGTGPRCVKSFSARGDLAVIKHGIRLRLIGTGEGSCGL